jgi:hypothetical protein
MQRSVTASVSRSAPDLHPPVLGQPADPHTMLSDPWRMKRPARTARMLASLSEERTRSDDRTRTPPYPYSHGREFSSINPIPDRLIPNFDCFLSLKHATTRVTPLAHRLDSALWRDVLVYVEEIVGIVGAFDLNQAIVVLPVVVSNSPEIVVLHEVDVAARLRIRRQGLVIIA